MPLRYSCVCCRNLADEEYSWYTDSGKLVTWMLCAECCDFAIDVVEVISNLDEEVEKWSSESS
jgi:hypothetical protein